MPKANPWLWALACCAASLPCRGAEPLQRFEAVERHMGTQFAIALYASSPEQARGALRLAFDRIAAIETRLTDYDPDSEARQLAAAGPHPRPLAISDDFRTVLAASLEYTRQTDGAFDVTVGPVVQLWRRARRTGKLPPSQQLQQALQRVGARHVRLSEEGAQLLRGGMRLDFGGIAKGYALDEALGVLQSRGVQIALVNGGGDVAVSASPPGKPGWKIGVAPLSADGPPRQVLILSHAAVATSGDTWQFVEIDGRRYSHIVDPRSGLGIVGRRSATVIAPRGIDADALASALCVLGPERGMPLIERQEGCAALLLSAKDEKIVEYRSKRFPKPDKSE